VGITLSAQKDTPGCRLKSFYWELRVGASVAAEVGMGMGTGGTILRGRGGLGGGGGHRSRVGLWDPRSQSC
jgi:hypothetical protein